jgi:hypothetical protein
MDYSEPLPENTGWKGFGRDRVNELSRIVKEQEGLIQLLLDEMTNLSQEIGHLPKITAIPNNNHPTEFVRYVCDIPGHTPVRERGCLVRQPNGQVLFEICSHVKRVDEEATEEVNEAV